MSYFKNINVEYQDSGNLDAFSRLRVSNSEQVFAIQQQVTYKRKMRMWSLKYILCQKK